MRRFLHFFQYNNAVPIALGVLFLGAGGAFAATNPDAIYSTQQSVLSVDNTYIANKDLSTWSPTATITSVTEDDENYYVQYQLKTIDIQDAVWRDVTKDEVMTVAKAFLGPYRDLGVYVTGQLKENIDHESARLATTQEYEKHQVSQKVVATMYGGLVGKMLDETTETLPGYTPVVTPPEAPVVVETAAAAGAIDSVVNASVGAVAQSSTLLQVLGNNPALIAMRSGYVDLGVVITDGRYANFGVHLYVDSREVPYVQLDTSTTSETIIRYDLVGQDGVLGSATRRVIVYDPAVGPPAVTQQHQAEVNIVNAPAPTTPVVPVVQPDAATTTEPTPSAMPDSQPPVTDIPPATQTPDVASTTP